MHETQSNRDRERDRIRERGRKKTSNKFIPLPCVVLTSIIAMALLSANNDDVTAGV